MLIPIGDNLERRSLPFVGFALITVNLLVGLYQVRLWNDSRPSRARSSQTLFQEESFHSSANFSPSSPPIAFWYQWGLRPIKFPEDCATQLVTHMFIHADVMHWVGNMMTLWVFLASLEAGMGPIGFLFLYLISGVAGGATHCMMYPDNPHPLIGASGAISGMIGAYFVAFGGLARIHFIWNGGILTGCRWVKFSLPAGAYVFFWIVIPQVAAMEQSLHEGAKGGGVAWFAHAGGFGAGVLMMLLAKPWVSAKLQFNRDGQICVGETEETVFEKKHRETLAKLGTAPVTVIPLCQYCRTPLTEGADLGDTLVRCGNPSCRSLNMVDTADFAIIQTARQAPSREIATGET